MRRALIILALCMLLAESAFGFGVGDRVTVISPVWVHPICPGFTTQCSIGPGTPTEPVYPIGTLGTVTGAEQQADGYTWAQVQFDPPLIQGWVTVLNLALVTSAPAPTVPGKVLGVAILMDTTPVLAWSPSASASAVGYKVYVSNTSNSYGAATSTTPGTTFTLTGLAKGTYFSVVTAYDANGLESLKSNEVTYTIP